MVTSKGEKKQCIIASKLYDYTIARFMALFDEAKNDFPELTREDVSIAVYAGRFHKGHNGIEFSVTSKVPVDYQEVSDSHICEQYPTV